MTRKDFLIADNAFHETVRSLQSQIIDVRNDHKDFIQRYVDEAFAASDYVVGQKISDDKGNTWYISGAHESNGYVYLSLNPAKKDGSMSKVTFIARGEPHICIN